MVKRFIDRTDRDYLIKKSGDFKMRYYGAFLVWVAYAIIVIIIGALLHVENVLYKSAIFTPTIPTIDVMMGALLMVMIILVFSGYLHIIISRLRQEVNAVEFQNMIFSSAMKANAKFTFIIDEEGTIIYSDGKSADMFSLGEEGAKLDDLLEHEGVKKADKISVKKAFEKGRYEEVPITIKNGKGQKNRVTMIIDKIERPKGYFSIRGQ